MMDRDMRPTRFDLTLEYAREFITEWFDQNPLGQIGIVGMRGGIGERIGEMSGAAFLYFLNLFVLMGWGNPHTPLLLHLFSLSFPICFFFFTPGLCVVAIIFMYREPTGRAPCDFGTA